MKRQADTPALRAVIPVTATPGTVFNVDQFFIRQVDAPDLNGDGEPVVTMTLVDLTTGHEQTIVVSDPFPSATPNITTLTLPSTDTYLGFRTAIIKMEEDGPDWIVAGMPQRPKSGGSSGIGGVAMTGRARSGSLTHGFAAPTTPGNGFGADVAFCFLNDSTGGRHRVVVGAPGDLEETGEDTEAGSVVMFDPVAQSQFIPFIQPWTFDLRKFGRFVDCGRDEFNTSVLVVSAVWAADVAAGQGANTFLSVYLNPSAPSGAGSSGPTESFFVPTSALFGGTGVLLGRSTIIADLTGDGHADIFSTYQTDNETLGLLIPGPLDGDEIRLVTIRFTRADDRVVESVWPLPEVLYEAGKPSVLILYSLHTSPTIGGEFLAFRLPITIGEETIVDVVPVSSLPGEGGGEDDRTTGEDGASTSSPLGVPTPAPTPTLVPSPSTGTPAGNSSLVLANEGGTGSSTLLAIVGAAVAVAVVALAILVAVVLRVRRRRRDPSSSSAAASSSSGSIPLTTRRGTAGRSRSGSTASPGIRRSSSRSLHLARPYEAMPRRPAAPPPATVSSSYVSGDLGSTGQPAPYAMGTFAADSNRYASGNLGGHATATSPYTMGTMDPSR